MPSGGRGRRRKLEPSIPTVCHPERSERPLLAAYSLGHLGVRRVARDDKAILNSLCTPVLPVVKFRL
jgi:hypothetical protein